MSELSEAELPPLPYDYDALEPHIDEQILAWHHDTHHQGYVNGLNAAEETLRENRSSGDMDGSAAAMRSVSHNGCGHYLHHLFWRCMTPNGGGGEPTGDLRDRIESDFGSYEGWEAEFREAASWPAGGWALLVYDPVTKQLRNLAVQKHNDGALWSAHPILALDVWEHSYYFQYGPDRGGFVDAFFEVIDWDTIASEFEKTTSHHEH
ncbi:superoxide dismutase (plasmid) [Haloferax mediterranei ATCC 33500]|nr:superoxide dismutase [Haloferax mediterranei]AFK21142.1 superoxide dismutase, Fe-Mn family [Haloferax mediterranei ATCC 33500]AHZ24334.1 superoxide dismutase [Haloferax mediterranei ATCC 33500]ELZ97068.1 Fe-Mn family superoxide dismutase [Haloferax mediterranei ATCC 33500]MDX5990185.1 superoxide dismutase [Haloferax mediterranei ATCC 33500]QCQ76742.1 superoxide dismutase [Haloferax mediterranei ATCC 33500]